MGHISSSSSQRIGSLFVYILCTLAIHGIRAVRPNFVIVLVDDLGWDDVGVDCEKEGRSGCVVSPELDRLMTDEGMVLTQLYVQPLCSPSRAALLTGKYPIHTGMQTHVLQPSQPGGLPLGHKLLPEFLKEQGYFTALIGKWHLGYSQKSLTPDRRGFDVFFGNYVGASDHFTHLISLGNYSSDTIFDTFLNGIDLHRNDEGVSNDEKIHSTDLFTSEALQTLRYHQQTNKDQPFFLYLSYRAVHDPIQVPNQTYVHANLHIQDPIRQQLAGMVTHLDANIKILVNGLKELHAWENTVFLFLSDNGGSVKAGSSNYPFRGVKGTVYEGGIKSRSFISGGYFLSNFESTRNLRCDAMIHITDILPTLIHLADASTKLEETELDGFNVWETLATGCPSTISDHKRREFLVNMDPVGYPLVPGWSPWVLDYFRYALAYKLGWADRVRAYRVGDFKYISGKPGAGVLPHLRREEYNYEHYKEEFAKSWFVQDVVQLFNLTRDPHERINLAELEAYRTIIQSIEEKLNALEQTMVFPVNRDGIMRYEQLIDFLYYMPIRCDGFLSPYEDKSCHGIWLSIVVVFTLCIAFPLIIAAGMRKLLYYL